MIHIYHILHLHGLFRSHFSNQVAGIVLICAAEVALLGDVLSIPAARKDRR